MKNKIREILENLANAQRGNMGNSEDYIEMCSIMEAEQKILDVIKEIVPEKRKWVTQNDGTIAEMDGFNQAIDQINQAIDKEFKNAK